MWEKKKVLVIVKTAPYILKDGREVVCTAGIDEKGNWIRMYPIQFRDLPPDKRFDKFQYIEVEAKFDKSDIGQRPDSYKVEQDSITPLLALDTQKDWNEINKLFLPTVSKSLEELREERAETGKSLGAFKPKQVINFEIRKITDNKRLEKRKAIQASLLTPRKKPLNVPPYDFIYTFTCADFECSKPHEMGLTAWEIVETARKWIKIYGSQWQDKIRQRFFDYLFKQRKTYFIAGTHAMSKHFMLIGYYSPFRNIIQETLL